MSDPIVTFFDAWQLEAADDRLRRIRESVIENVVYNDPRTPEAIHGVPELDAYVGMFAANAPGWAASVVACDEIAGVHRATVAFGGPGPDGKDKVQHGQYFIEKDGDRLSRLVGFAGLGSPA